jgi:small subunit ribosomal protein S20
LPKPSRKGISARKRWRQSVKRQLRNRSVRSHTRTILNRALSTVAADAASAETSVRAAVSAIDVAVRKGVLHANAAARTKSRLLKRFNLAQASAVAAAAAAAPPPTEPEPKAPTRRRAPTRKTAEETPPAPKPTRARRAAPKAEDEKPAPRSRGRRTSS